MKNLIILASIILLLAISCKKLSKEPEGPTDIRIKNITTLNMSEIFVSTGGGEFNFGSLKPDSVTSYHRFDKAYPLVNISAIIKGVKYKTDTVTSYVYQQYLGQMKATYKLYILNDSKKQLAIDVVPESALK